MVTISQTTGHSHTQQQTTRYSNTAMQMTQTLHSNEDTLVAILTPIKIPLHYNDNFEFTHAKSQESKFIIILPTHFLWNHLSHFACLFLHTFNQQSNIILCYYVLFILMHTYIHIILTSFQEHFSTLNL